MDKDLTEVKKLEKWKEKKQRNRDKKLKKSKKIFVKRRKWQDEVEEIQELEKSYEEFDIAKAEHFKDFPLSSKTKTGLEKAEYINPTAIQRASFLPSIKGGDILGAAKTGSGKTLAFLIPVLECLFRQRWTAIAGPGALIISPTRELAYQTFEVLKKVGRYHDFSAGLVIGGKDVKSEAAHMSRTNILICTPGRLLQHMDETSYFDASSLQILVLDEADRILDLGFKASVNAILENLPTDKQTLLFSATQTKSVKDLARLSLKNPSYVSVHEKSRTSTPSGLIQKYIICKLEDKLNVLYSFVKNHLKTKMLVFLTSCKQVQYIYAAFCKLRPGVPVMMLHGRMNQMKRMAVYDEFCRKQFALLFCTDVAARGLDFPAVDWVVQLDCPEDAETYIHRAGRTARYHGEGQALLFLLESEEGMVKQMQDKKVPISKTEINSEKITKIDSRLESFCAAEQALKEKAQRCFVSYIRSIFLMKNKSVFSVQSLPLSEYAASLGLAVTPRVRFLQRQGKKTQSIFNEKTEDKNPEIGNSNKDFVNTSSTLFSVDDISSDSVGDMFVVKRKDVFGLGSSSAIDEKTESWTAQKDLKQSKALSKAAQTKKLLKKKYKYNQKILFNKDGELAESWPPVDPKEYKNITVIADEGEKNGIDIEKVRLEMKERDTEDQQRHRDKIRQRHQEKRRKEKEMRRQLQAKKEGRYYGGDNEEVIAYLGSPDLGNVEEVLESEEYSEIYDMTVNPERIPLKRSRNHLKGEDEDKLKRKRINADGSAALSDLMHDAGMSLREEEDLALHFLKGN